MTKIVKPENWVYRRTIERGNVWGVELPPKLWQIQYRGYNGLELLSLSMPRTLWFITTINKTVADCYIVAIKTPFLIKRMKTRVYYLPLPNVDDNFCLCAGDDFKYPNKDSEPEGKMIDRFIRFVISESVWNDDLNTYDDSLIELGFEDIYGWAQKSKGAKGKYLYSKIFSLTSDKQFSSHTVKELLENIA